MQYFDETFNEKILMKHFDEVKGHTPYVIFVNFKTCLQVLRKSQTQILCSLLASDMLNSSY